MELHADTLTDITADPPQLEQNCFGQFVPEHFINDANEQAKLK